MVVMRYYITLTHYSVMENSLSVVIGSEPIQTYLHLVGNQHTLIFNQQSCDSDSSELI